MGKKKRLRKQANKFIADWSRRWGTQARVGTPITIRAPRTFTFDAPGATNAIAELNKIKAAKNMNTENFDADRPLIAEGTRYRLRNGTVVGPLARATAPDGSPAKIWAWKWMGSDGWWNWTEDGCWKQSREASQMDIMEEFSEPKSKFAEPDADYARQEKEFAELDRQFGSKSAPAPFSKSDLLHLALAATADRGLNYGKPEDNFQRIAELWSVHLKNRTQHTAGPHFITAGDVAIMCALLKIAHLENDPRHKDSWVDLAGYAACGAEIELAKAGGTTK